MARATKATPTTHELEVRAEWNRSRCTARNIERLEFLRHEYTNNRLPEADIMAVALSELNKSQPHVVAYALWFVFGLGTRPTQQHFDALAAFRISETAQVWHTFIYGSEYEPQVVLDGYEMRTERAKATTQTVQVEVIESDDALQAGLGIGVA